MSGDHAQDARGVPRTAARGTDTSRVQRRRELRQRGASRLLRFDVGSHLSSAIGSLPLLRRSRLEGLLACAWLKSRVA